MGLEIVPILNKTDLPGAEPERVREQIESVIGIDASGAILTSAKQGVGIDEVLEAIVTHIPPPTGDPARHAARAPIRLMVRASTGASWCWSTWSTAAWRRARASS